MKRGMRFLVAVAAVVGFGAATANADYPPSTPEINTSSASPAPGASVTITIGGFCAETDVTFTITPPGTVLDTVTTNGSGAAEITFTAPATAGVYTITATAVEPDCPGADGGQVASLALTVGGRVPNTGSDTGSTLSFGAIAVALGAALVGFAAIRRRRHAVA